MWQQRRTGSIYQHLSCITRVAEVLLLDCHLLAADAATNRFAALRCRGLCLKQPSPKSRLWKDFCTGWINEWRTPMLIGLYEETSFDRMTWNGIRPAKFSWSSRQMETLSGNSRKWPYYPIPSRITNIAARRNKRYALCQWIDASGLVRFSTDLNKEQHEKINISRVFPAVSLLSQIPLRW